MVLILAALVAASCSGPGAAYGVTSYNCTNCGIEMKEPGRTTYLFHAEPTVLSVEPGSALQVGDVIVAVGEKAITTREGADMFSYPSKGVTFVRVRRRGGPVVLRVQVTADCATADRDMAAGAATGRFGFAVSCLPSCVRARGSDGTDYWKFNGEPPVAKLRAGGPAEIAGVQIGDRVVRIDGESVLSEKGALRLLRSQSSGGTLRLEVMRGDRVIAVDLRGDVKRDE